MLLTLRSRGSWPTSLEKISLVAMGCKTIGSLTVSSPRPRSNSVSPESASDLFVHSTMAATELVSTTILDNGEALKPDHITEAEFEVEINKFAFSPGQLAKLYNPKSLSAFHALGGLEGLEKGLRSDTRGDLSIDEAQLNAPITWEDTSNDLPLPRKHGQQASIAPVDHHVRSIPNLANLLNYIVDRKRMFFDKSLSEHQPMDFRRLAWKAYKQKFLILLIIAVVVELACASDVELNGLWGRCVVVVSYAILSIGIIRAVPREHGEKEGFIGQQKKKDHLQLNAVHPSKQRQLPVNEVLVDEVVHLELRDRVVADGFLVRGYNIKRDQSSVTDDFDLSRQPSGSKVQGSPTTKLDPFHRAVSKVMESVGSFLVTANRQHSLYGRHWVGYHQTSVQEDFDSFMQGCTKTGNTIAIEKPLVANSSKYDSIETIHRSMSLVGTRPLFLRRAPILWTMLVLFSPTVAAQSPKADTQPTWKQRSQAMIEEILVSCAFLVAPALLLFMFFLIATWLRCFKKEKSTLLLMLWIAAVFMSIHQRPSDKDKVNTEAIQLATGLGYGMITVVYCELVTLRNNSGKLFCFVAIAIGTLSTLILMAFVSVQTYWLDRTKLDPFFALAFAIPLSFCLCDIAIDINNKINGYGHLNGLTTDQASCSSQIVGRRTSNLPYFDLAGLRERRTIFSDSYDNDADMISLEQMEAGLPVTEPTQPNFISSLWISLKQLPGKTKPN